LLPRKLPNSGCYAIPAHNGRSFACQNLYTALAVADRIYVLETGKVVHEARSSEIARDPNAFARYLGAN
jgi:ABC-type lipopolysaccharide export system ATPase subunit